MRGALRNPTGQREKAYRVEFSPCHSIFGATMDRRQTRIVLPRAGVEPAGEGCWSCAVALQASWGRYGFSVSLTHV